MPTNALHLLFRDPTSSADEQLRLVREQPSLLEEEDDSWEGWLPLHNAARWGAPFEVVHAAVSAFPDAAKQGSTGGYEALHLAAMGGHLDAVRAIIAGYPEGALKKDNNGRTPLDEAREGSSPSHEAIVAELLALPGVREADEAEQQLRAQHADELMQPDCDEDGVYREEAHVSRSVEEGGFGVTATALSLANALASRMFRAASNALWATEEPAGGLPAMSKQELAAFFTERAKYIPLRLEYRERSYLKLMEGVLRVSEYTDRVDSAALAASPAKRKQAIRKEIHAVLAGLLLACDYEAGQQAMSERAFEEYPDFFAPLFEVARRYKIMNPEKMRDTYGKMIYLLQDASTQEMAEELGFSLVAPIQTVHAKLKHCGALALLEDDQIATATQVVTSDPGKSRAAIQRQIKQKEAAIEYLARRYRSAALPDEELKQCLYSIADNNAYLYQARDPVDQMIRYLKEHFPESGEPSERTSLAIAGGESGARLTHSHAKQYAFVLQSLTLWREIANDMFRLWYLAEDDLVRASNPYAQRDTGQGLQRVQHAPRTTRAMHQLLHTTQSKCGSWVGSSLIHLGDSNVPNALMFIDKYSQVEHILHPILSTLSSLEQLIKDDEALNAWMHATFGGLTELKLAILQDFFRFGFDGSGADNFFDAGSCIDGRLTSAWNWCSSLPHKPFYIAFQLTGNTSFDGQFQV